MHRNDSITAYVTITVCNPLYRFLRITNINNTMPPKTSKKIKELQLELKLHVSQLTRAVDYAHKHPKEAKSRVAKAFGVNPTTAAKVQHQGLKLDKHNNCLLLVKRRQ